MAIDLDVVTRLNRASAREAAREGQNAFRGTGDDIGEDLGDGIARGISAKTPEIADSLRKVTDASGKLLVEQEKLNALKEKGNATDSQLVAQSERVARAYRSEESAIQAANRAIDEHNARNNTAVASMGALTSALSTAGSAAGQFASSFGQIGLVAAVGTLPAAVTAVVALGGAIQQLSGAGLALPGIFAGLTASAGTAALGMHGMKDAFDATIKAADGTQASVDAAREALAGLSPNAADAVTTVVGLKGTFEDLRNISSQNMFAGFSGGLRDMVGNLLPSINRGVDGISRGINENLLQAMDSLGSSSSQGFIERILGNTAQAQGQLTAAIDPMINAIGTLTAAGSDTLPRLAEAVGNVANRFNSFITNANATGDLAKWIDQGLDGFTNLGNAVLNIGKAFTGITEAAGGGQGLLTLLEAATARFAAFANSADGQQKMATYFQQGRDLLVQLLDVAQSAGPVLGGMLQAATSVAQAYLPLIQSILETINGIPGGAQTVVAAFVGWKMISGVSALTTSLTTISGLLGTTLPASAQKGASGISSALSKVAVPAWLTYLMYDQGKSIYDNATRGDAQFPGQTTPTDPTGSRGLQNRTTGGTVMGVPSYANSGPFQSNKLPIAAADQYGAAGAQADRRGFRLPNATPDQFAAPGAQADRRGGYAPVATPGLSSYTAPIVTEAGSAGSAPPPQFDASQWQVNPGDTPSLAGGVGTAPVAGVGPGGFVVDQNQVLSATERLSEAKLRLLELEADTNVKQSTLVAAKNNVNQAERELIEAQQGTWKKANDAISGAMGDLNTIFAPLDEDFGISKGIPGIVENLTKMFGNMALGSAIGASPDLQAGAAFLAQNGGVAPGLFNRGLFTQGDAGTTAYGPSAMGPAAFGGGMGAASISAMPGEDARTFAHRAMMPYWESQGLTVGDHAADKYGEHQNGALDIMVDNIAQGNAVLQQVLSDPNVKGAIFNNQVYGYGQGMTPRPYSGGNTGNPTQDHQDHVHALYDPGNPGNMNPGGAVFGQSTSATVAPSVGGASPVLGSASSGGTTSVFVVNMPAAGFAPVGGAAPGPATPSAMGPNALQPPMTPGVGAGPPPGPGALPSIIPGSAGQGFLGMQQQPGVGGAAAQPVGFNTGNAPQATAGGGGIGLSGDMMAMAGGAMDMMAPGSSVALKLANRAIQYGGQVAGIAAQGAMETFLPAGSALAGGSWFNKLAGGLAGARPAAPNKAGGGATPPQQQGQQPGGQPGQPGEQKPGITVNYTNNQATEDRAGADLTNHLQAAYQGPGR